MLRVDRGSTTQPGDLALPGDTVRTIIADERPSTVALGAYGPIHDCGVIIERWPNAFTGERWRVLDER